MTTKERSNEIATLQLCHPTKHITHTYTRTASDARYQDASALSPQPTQPACLPPYSTQPTRASRSAVPCRVSYQGSSPWLSAFQNLPLCVARVESSSSLMTRVELSSTVVGASCIPSVLAPELPMLVCTRPGCSGKAVILGCSMWMRCTMKLMAA